MVWLEASTLILIGVGISSVIGSVGSYFFTWYKTSKLIDAIDELNDKIDFTNPTMQDAKAASSRSKTSYLIKFQLNLIKCLRRSFYNKKMSTINGGTWVRPNVACKYYGVCQSTLRKWALSGLVEFQVSKGGHRIYRLGATNPTSLSPPPTRSSFIYVRVSSNKQRDDLERQSKYLEEYYPTHSIIKDVGSGLNYNRRGLIKLLDAASKGLVQEVVVASKDRLCRFGFELIELLFKQNDVKLVVFDKEETDKSPEQEFTEDILAILQVFACRWNGKRKYTVNNGKKNQIVVDVDIKE